MAPDMLDTAEAAVLPFDARLGRALQGIPFLDDATRPKAPPRFADVTSSPSVSEVPSIPAATFTPMRKAPRTL